MSGKYIPVIGVEVHIQSESDRKIFCNCKNVFGALPNTNICPICTGQPGALPVFNRNILMEALRLGLALNCRINLYTRFDRKNYFYPDTPKNYQITQKKYPIGYEGNFFFYSSEGNYSIGIESIHMEEDSAKMIHNDDSFGNGSMIDYNRAGVPLLEIVTMPGFRDGDTVVYFLEFLKRTVSYLGISACNMEEGSLRADINISLTEDEDKVPDYKVEIKNLNSFSGVKNAIEYEINRQESLLEKGNEIVSETRNYNESTQKTVSMRKKATQSEYRYFPEPDIPPILLSEKKLFEMKGDISLTPGFAMNQLVNSYRLERSDAYILSADRAMYEFFIEASRYCIHYDKLNNWITGDLVHELRERDQELHDCDLDARSFAEAVNMVEAGKLTGKIFKELIPRLLNGEDLHKTIDKENISVIDDQGYLEDLALRIIDDNPAQVKSYKKGKKGLMGFFMGMIMKETSGRCDPRLSQSIFERLLGDEKE